MSPAYWSMSAYRGVLTDDGGVARPVAALVAFTFAFLVVALWAFRVDQPKESFPGE